MSWWPELPFAQIGLATLASFLAGMATAIGALAVLLVRQLSRTMEDILLSVAAGIMLAASIFSLLLPGLEHASGQFSGEGAGLVVVSLGMLIGALVMWSLNHVVPHEHLHLGREGPQTERMRRIWLFVFAIALHNLPEGIAVGVGMMQESLAAGISLAVGIGLQNIPEGMAVAVAMISVGYTRRVAIGVAVLTGLIEPIGGLFGAVAVSLAAPLLGAFLGLAAGAMLYVILDEIVPEVHRRGTSSHITFAMFAGFLMMMYLDVLFAA